MRIYLSSVLILAASSALGQSRPTLFEDAVRAMGGEAAIRAATSLTIEASGRNYNFGQGMAPAVPLPRFDVSELRRSTDLTAVRHRHEVTRTAAFTTAVAIEHGQFEPGVVRPITRRPDDRLDGREVEAERGRLLDEVRGLPA
mgnify:CR=1 FL=1